MTLWAVAWSPRTRQHCIHHHPGPCNRWFIGHSFCPTSKGEGDSWKQAKQFTITMQTTLSMAPPTFWNWSETLFQAIPWDQFIPDVLQLITGAATSLSWFIRRCQLFRLASLVTDSTPYLIPSIEVPCSLWIPLTHISGCHLDLITIVHFWLRNTAHCTERIVSELLSRGSVSAEGVGQGKWGGVGWDCFSFFCTVWCNQKYTIVAIWAACNYIYEVSVEHYNWTVPSKGFKYWLGHCLSL